MSEQNYLRGFSNHHHTEAEANTLPRGCNSPQKAPKGLYSEQLSGTAFTMPHHRNRRSWFYRILPSVVQYNYQPMSLPFFRSSADLATPEPLRWSPFECDKKASFLEGIKTLCVSGSVQTQSGSSVHVYLGQKPMKEHAFANFDGDMLYVPQSGNLIVTTECGVLEVGPLEILVIPRGMYARFDAKDPKQQTRGYILENYGQAFELPPRGVIGSNGLANERDFMYPVANYETSKSVETLVIKTQGKFFSCQHPGSKFNVVAWHGNYAPYKYDLRLFNTMGSISYDHPDPSIFTVLTSPSTIPGTANADFVIFPPRWLVMEDSFRPPWYHRNFMSEFMGLITGEYDAKSASEFAPGGASLHNSMSSHGPDRLAFEKASFAELKPEKLSDTMAFMFESALYYNVVDTIYDSRQKGYLDCWKGLRQSFPLEWQRD